MTGDELKAWMTEHGYSVRGLAARLGKEPSTVQRWRTGESPIDRVVELALRSL